MDLFSELKIEPTKEPVYIGSKLYRFYIFRQDATKRVGMSDPCHNCDLTAGSKHCDSVNCIKDDMFLYLKEVKL